MTRPTRRSADTVCTLWQYASGRNEYNEPINTVIAEYAVMAQVKQNPMSPTKFTDPAGNEFTPKTIFVYELTDINGNTIEPPTPSKTNICIGNYVGIDKPSSGVNKVVNFEAPTTGVLRGQIPDVRVYI